MQKRRPVARKKKQAKVQKKKTKRKTLKEEIELLNREERFMADGFKPILAEINEFSEIAKSRKLTFKETVTVRGFIAILKGHLKQQKK